MRKRVKRVVRVKKGPYHNSLKLIWVETGLADGHTEFALNAIWEWKRQQLRMRFHSQGMAKAARPAAVPVPPKQRPPEPAARPVPPKQRPPEPPRGRKPAAKPMPRPPAKPMPRPPAKPPPPPARFIKVISV